MDYINQRGRSTLFLVFLFMGTVLMTMTFLSGCSKNDSTPLRVAKADEYGTLRIGITTKIRTPLAYAPGQNGGNMAVAFEKLEEENIFHSPGYATDAEEQELRSFDDPITLNSLEQVTLYISKIEAFAESGKKATIFESDYVEEGRLKVREAFQNRYYAGWTSTAVPAGNYKRIEITIREVQAKWKNQYNEDREWFDHSFDRVLKLHSGQQFSGLKLGKGDYVEMDTYMVLNERVGKIMGQFEPAVYMVIKNHKSPELD